MCLYIKDHEKGITPSTATEDIYVYKHIDLESTILNDSEYFKPKAYFRKNYYYSKIEKAKFRRVGELIYSGLHSMIFDANKFDNKGISIWVIPKGAKYYLGLCNEIVSNKLIFHRYFDKEGKDVSDKLIWEKPSIKRDIIRFIDYVIDYLK